ncbi:MAG: glycosyltransferase family 4 protein [Bacteroidales bacterium]|nr:glycosyltransferase family 4 protein [Bacteroidales bacterium]
MKKVLIITYYWPPSGGGGVMRWLKMSKYLPELGWQPIIYTPENPDPSVTDSSLLKEIHPETRVIKTPIWEPYEIYRKITGKLKEEKFKAGYISEASSGDWKNKLSVYIRGNFLIPDPRKFWIKPSIKYLSVFLKSNHIDLIVTTGPPHSMHLIGSGLKKKFNIPWIADFRDPWTDIDFYSRLRLSEWADKKHHALELKVLRTADHIVTVSPSWAEELQKKTDKPVTTVYNGFDPQDFINLPECNNSEFSITHLGSFNRDRNPPSLWAALNSLSIENPHFKHHLRIYLIGQTDNSVLKDIKKYNLSDNLILINHLPHKEGIDHLAKSQILLLPINNTPNSAGILPGKMYEYLAVRRPILAIGPSGADFAKIIKRTNSGEAIDFNDIEKIKSTILNYFLLYQQQQLYIEGEAGKEFSRKELARKFMKITETL